MTTSRTDRLIAIAAFVAAVAILMVLAGALGATLGPVEFLVVVVLAVVASVLVGRFVQARRRDRHV